MQKYDIKITKTTHSNIDKVDFKNLGFGKYFTDHMLVADYKNGAWQDVHIEPYGTMEFLPAMSVLHYGQAYFEGIKAHKSANGDGVNIFRPYDNLKRANLSAERLEMPHIPEEIFIDGMRKLIEVDAQFIPTGEDEALYIRPFMFATEETLGVKASSTYRFVIILSPVGAYFPEPAKIFVEEKYTRAAPGGYGYAKAAGNYAGSLVASTEAKKAGFDQVLWTDAAEHKYVQEVGTMNIFFIVGNKALTPDLSQGTILHGVTRASIITLLKERGIEVEERPITVDELADAYKSGELKEVFGTGTAAVITFVQAMQYKDFAMSFSVENMKIAHELKQQIVDIKEGRIADNHNWLVKV